MSKKTGKEIIAGEPIPPKTPSGNVYINNLNVIVQPLREFVDPIAKVCYEPLLEHYDKRYRKHWDVHAHKILLIDLALIFLAAAGLVGGILAYYVLPQDSRNESVETVIGSPIEVISGGASSISVSWSNDTGGTLACAGLKIDLPEASVRNGPIQGGNFGSGVCEPIQDTDGLVVPLGDLQPNQRGTVIVPVKFYGKEGDRVVATSELIYWESGQAIASRAAARIERIITDSVLPVSVSLVSPAKRGEAVSFDLTYENKSDEKIDGAEIRLTLPDDIAYYGANRAPSSNLRWRLPVLLPQEKGSIRIYGRLRSANGPLGTVVSADSFIEDSAGTPRQTSETRKNLDPRAAALQLNVDLNRSEFPTSVQPNTESLVTVSYKNNGTEPIDNLEIWLHEDCRAFTDLRAPTDLTWKPADENRLKKVMPREGGEVTASLHWRTDLSEATDLVRLIAYAKYYVPGDENNPVVVETVPAELGIAASLGLRATAAYYTVGGDQIGIGPLPPRVGETTKYWVFLEASVVGGSVQELSAEGKLAENVHWTGRTSALAGSPPKYDPTMGTVTWQLGSLKEGQPALVGFEVALTPTEDQADETAPLLTAITSKARDVRSGRTLYAQTTDADTNLEYDLHGTGLGKVMNSN